MAHSAPAPQVENPEPLQRHKPKPAPELASLVSIQCVADGRPAVLRACPDRCFPYLHPFCCPGFEVIGALCAASGSRLSLLCKQKD